MGYARVVAGKGLPEIRQPRKFKLGNGGLWRIHGGEEARQIECRLGKIWITQSGCLEDIVLVQGQKQCVDGSGLVLVQALADSELAVE